MRDGSEGARMLRWLWLAVLVVGLDQVTKIAADYWLEYHDPVPLVPFFNLMLSYNTGAAFSFLSDAGGWQRWFFVVLALGVSTVIVLWMYRLPTEQRWTAAALALVLGGAIGNVVDRVLYGHVIDFLDFYVGNWHWPTFNVADSAITVGVAILILDGLFGSGQMAKK